MKKFTRIALAVSLLSSFLMGQQIDPVAEGCKDILKDRTTFSSGYILGMTAEMNMLGLDVLHAMGYQIVQGLDLVDAKKACKKFFILKRDEKFKNANSVLLMSFILRGELVRANGYTWDEVQARKKYMQEAIGLSKKKKY